MEDRDFKGIWIPKEIWLDDRLSAIEKVILAEIDSLDGEQGCWAGNEYLAEFCQCSVSKVSKTITKLIELRYIEIQYFDGRNRIIQSRIVNYNSQPSKKSQADYEKVNAINIINNKENNIDNIINDELQETWKAYVDMRKKIKKPMTDYAQKLALKKLDELSNGDVDVKIKILNQSIVNSWQGLFPLKEEKNKPKFPQQKQYGRDETSFNIQEAENQAQNTNALNFGTVKRKKYKGKDDF